MISTTIANIKESTITETSLNRAVSVDGCNKKIENGGIRNIMIP